MKYKVLDNLYTCFKNWSHDNSFICSAGCSTCCTRNVTLTSMEARRIAEYLIENNLQTEIIEELATLNKADAPQETTNDYVRNLLAGGESDVEITPPDGVCPLLKNDHCTIYPVRPFSCRCFASTKNCTTSHAAVVPDHYLYGCIAVMQILEHLDCSRSWGYLTDLLTAELKRSNSHIVRSGDRGNSATTPQENEIVFSPVNHSRDFSSLMLILLLLPHSSPPS